MQPTTTKQEDIKDRLCQSLGERFWKNHEEVPQILQWVRTVDTIHNRLDQRVEEYELFNRQRHILNPVRMKFLDTYDSLYDIMDMDPNKDLEEITRRISNELWDGDFCYLDRLSSLVIAVVNDCDGWLLELLQPLAESTNLNPVTFNRIVHKDLYPEPCDLALGVRQKRSLWPWIRWAVGYSFLLVCVLNLIFILQWVRTGRRLVE